MRSCLRSRARERTTPGSPAPAKRVMSKRVMSKRVMQSAGDAARAQAGRPLRLVLACWLMVVCAVVLSGCAPELEKLGQRRSPRGSLGVEVYKALCRRVAGTEMPGDVSGRRSEAVCLGDDDAVEGALAQAAQAPIEPAEGVEPLTPRLVALAERRAALVQAVDDTMSFELGDELEHLFRGLLPFYDPPEERIQQAMRELALVLERLANPSDPNALEGLARVARKGMAPPEGTLGLIRGTLGAASLRDTARSVLPLLNDEPAVRQPFDTLMSGLALEFSTLEVNAPPDSDLARLKKLLLRSHVDFGSGKPLFGSVRDARGLPTPTPSGSAVPFPFVDADGDSLADADGPRLLTVPQLAARLPEPFATRDEGPVVRDAFGRASGISAGGTSEPTRTLYLTQDADTTLLAGVLRSGQKLFRDDKLSQQLSLVLPAIVGEHAPASERYGALEFGYSAPNLAASPLLDVLHGTSALLDRDVTVDALTLTKALLESHESSLVSALEPLLTLERRSRPDDDAYPNAQLPDVHIFWDEMLFELEKISRRRREPDGETLLEALMRASIGFGRNLQEPGAPIEQIVSPELLRHQGVVLSTLMRFKDEWRSNPKGESERMPGEPVILGGFRTPVDRDQPDLPVTCGRDGCGGLIEGTPFEVWKNENQNCAVQRLGRPISGRDCGQAPNQSLLQRSLGLIFEMAGRSQCNKPISIGDLLDYAVLTDPCVGDVIPDSPECELKRRAQRAERASSVSSAEQAVRDDYTCPSDDPSAPCSAYLAAYPAAFVDPDGSGGAPATIPACHLLDLPDVGRTFGAAVTHEFQLQVPNPWVRRYLEDVARAGDHDGDGAPDLPACVAPFKIVDPSVAPPCIPEAASLSRDIYKDMPGSVDTLGELIEFLLDDSSLFPNDQDTADLRPDVKAMSRVLFAPAGSTSFIIFDPLLLHGAPPACAARPELPVCGNDDSQPDPAGGCCIKDLTRPPLRYRLDTYYGSTSFAWEKDIRLNDGTTISFLDTMRPLSDAMARFDFDAARDDPQLFEDTSYLFSTLGKLIAQHYDSRANTSVQSSNVSGMSYRRLTGLVRYEAMLADALDDGSIDRTQLAADNQPLYDPAQVFAPAQQLGLLYRGLGLVAVLDQLTLDSGSDGIDVSAEVTEQLLNPHARCAGPGGDRRVIAGVGACDRQAKGEPGLTPPFAYRSGDTTRCWNDGACFDGKALPKLFTSPAYVLLDGLAAMDDRVKADPVRDRALRGVLSGLLDAYATVREGRFDDRRVRALLSALLDDLRDRVNEERAAGTLSSYGARSDQDAADLLHNPVVAGFTGLLESLQGRGSALADLSKLSASVLSEGAGQNNLRPLLSGAFDLVQLLPGDAQSNAALRALGSAFVTNVDEAVRGQAAPASPQTSAIGRNLYMLRQTAKLDTGAISVLERVLGNLARVPEGRTSPLDVFLDVALEVNRVTPGSQLTPSASDLRLTLASIAEVLVDRKRGLERLFAIVRCTRVGASEAGCE
jgi:hypothetical protein